MFGYIEECWNSLLFTQCSQTGKVYWWHWQGTSCHVLMSQHNFIVDITCIDLKIY